MAKPSWLSVTPTSGSGNSTISNTSSEHTGRLMREGVVTIQGSGVNGEATYRVIQAPKAEFVEFDDDDRNIAVSQEGGTVTIAGTSNSEGLEFIFESEDTDILPEVNDYYVYGMPVMTGKDIPNDPGATSQYPWEITVDIPENTTTESIDRELIVLTAGGKENRLHVIQTAGTPFLTVEPTEINIPQAGGTVTVQVKSNTSWTLY